MSRAEERANERYGITRGDDTQETSGVDMQRASDYIDGYHQAEQDLELTWEDIKVIEKLLGFDNVIETPKEFYQGVLKRFLWRKSEKKKSVTTI